jgi:hypothetical protein
MNKFLKTLFISPLLFLCGTEHKNINRLSLWTMLLALFTLILFIIAGKELNEIKNSRNAEFLKSFDADFFTPESRELIMLFENDLIEFQVSLPGNDPSGGKDSIQDQLNDFGCFIIKSKMYPRINSILLDSTKCFYTSYEIDDILLNKLDNIGGYEQNGIIKIDEIDRIFRFYIEVTWENKEIQKYIKWMKKKYPHKDFFAAFRKEYEKLHSSDYIDQKDNN